MALFPFLLYCIGWTSNTMWNRDGKSGHACLFPDCRGKAFIIQSFTIKYDPSHRCFCKMCLSNWKFCFSLNFVKVFVIAECWIRSNPFVCWDYYLWFFFILLIWWAALIDFKINQIPDIHLSWSQCFILSSCRWIQFNYILLRIFCIYLYKKF